MVEGPGFSISSKPSLLVLTLSSHLVFDLTVHPSALPPLQSESYQIFFFFKFVAANEKRNACINYTYKVPR